MVFHADVFAIGVVEEGEPPGGPFKGVVEITEEARDGSETA